ncbi:MAG: ribosome silencing factor [Candidatus Raymondbacteria bacterium RifOxyA12_full_50_37]|uniref:Ribosomal silencing factor RsfS n=1 Tax=Candidatus Raymondbacteria bacterium RIFOXYD12_FULL_49_13 TaxID=1817890 RepID=A0A1F7F983_UNCRA|nr:MAG: ribosome silencing factor [Candidatus Raymondbacteria bacterium RIFOXYA2_FULL_49_16]OGJ90725.1 MAG: ribosome silencing factor [Candidatus Raymondbacteria bacterium RifOxyA12_full_50_37]OGJ91703.1 MAG: ribosome silencing factor [Candidatus Raymondbacteria bacterium RifOxyB12_full_50_8]OGJ98362.1 MAG: ribosome silencing factor [Candidatus Raymondbacteria bacterium RIFOXYC2_FULL_50_21]OGK03087.1 MAG: ribosome silencing factor [Candidatus Raymondbacteria bacterium RIFOXYD12_FULL_49_13]OGK0
MALLGGKKLVDRIIELALEKKALNIKIMDLRKLSGPSDFFVIVSGSSEPHLRAISDSIYDGLKKQTERLLPLHVDGYYTPDWIVMDYFDVIVHIFLDRKRSFYDIEELWSDAKPVTLRKKSTQRKTTPVKRKKAAGK